MNKNINADKFVEWLKSGEIALKLVDDYGHNYLFTRIEKTREIHVIFAQFLGASINVRLDKLEYAGLYRVDTCELFDTQYVINSIVYGDLMKTSLSLSLASEQFSTEVSQRITELIGNDRTRLDIKGESEIKSNALLNDLKNIREYRERDRVESMFYSGQKPEDIVFSCSYSKSNFSDDDFVEYILSPDKLINEAAIEWIKANQEQILIRFLLNDILQEELQLLIDDKSNPAHVVKAIKDSLKGTDCKTVNVTIVKDGVTLTFKTDVHTLSWSNDFYSTYYMAAKDRRKFKELYGNLSDYFPHEIVRITHGRKLLYEVDSANIKKEHVCQEENNV